MNGLSLVGEGVNLDVLRQGLLAAQRVLSDAGVTPWAALWAVRACEHDSEAAMFGVDEAAVDDTTQRAADAWDDAVDAATKAVYGEAPHIGSTLELNPVGKAADAH